MAQAANHVAGVAVVVRVTAERRVEAQFAAFLGCADVLINGIHRFQYAPGDLLELAQLHRLVHAVILQVVDALGRLEGRRASHRQTIHVRQLALLRGVVEIGGSVGGEKEKNYYYIFNNNKPKHFCAQVYYTYNE